MRHQVPQSLDIEDKIFGPLTFKQFLYLGGGLGLGYLCYAYLPSYIGLPLGLALLGLGLALAFLKINKKSFAYMMEAFFRHIFGSKLYVWRRKTPEEKAGEKEKQGKREESEKPQEQETPGLSGGTLKELAWSLDIHSRGESNSSEPPSQTQ